MSKRVNIISYILTMCITLASLLGVVLVCNKVYMPQMMGAVLKLLVGAIVAGFLCCTFHELGHLWAGKKNGFVFSSLTIWCLNWKRVKKKIKFSFVMFGDESGYTEMIPTTTENLANSYKKLSSGGYKASFVLMLLGLVPFVITLILQTQWINIWIYSIWTMLLPIGAYYYFGNVLPTATNGIKNDGAIVYHIKKQTDEIKVSLNLLSIQAQLYNGKTPSEIDKSFYFDLPQLPEDNFVFAMLLNARYYYYLDLGDKENLLSVSERINSILDYMPKSLRYPFMTDLLYNACAIEKNEEVADDLMYELEKYLNKNNTATNVRAKMAYLLYVKGETAPFEMFYKKGVKEANRCQIKGLGTLEKKLFDQMLKDVEQSNADLN